MNIAIQGPDHENRLQKWDMCNRRWNKIKINMKVVFFSLIFGILGGAGFAYLWPLYGQEHFPVEITIPAPEVKIQEKVVDFMQSKVLERNAAFKRKTDLKRMVENA